MHRPYDGINIPIEIVRTLVTIANLGSYSQAGEKLGLSQPAISAQVKRAQVLVGGTLFDRRDSGGVALTELGRLVLHHARIMLASNDRILSLSQSGAPQLQRVGLCTIYASDFVDIMAAEGCGDRLMITCGNSSDAIAKDLSDGLFDIAVIAKLPGQSPLDIVDEWEEEFVWARSRDFVLSPNAPVPLICSPESDVDQPPIRALEKVRRPYRICFTSAEYRARLAAAAAGIGVLGMPRRHIRSPLVVAKEHYLPPLAHLRVVICARPGGPPVENALTLLRRLAPGRAESRSRRSRQPKLRARSIDPEGQTPQASV